MVNKEIENLVTFTQQKWAKTVLEIGKAYRSKSSLENLISELLNNIYAFNYCEVLFKPTLANKKVQFRSTREELNLIFWVKIIYVKKTMDLL